MSDLPKKVEQRKPENAQLRARIDEVLKEMRDEVAEVHATADRKRSTMSKLIVLMLLFMFVLLGTTFQQSYEGRKTFIQNAQKGCGRAIETNKDSRDVTQTNLDLFHETDKKVPPSALRLKKEKKLQHKIIRFNERTKIDCTKAYPAASPWPWNSR